jgi:hypothetical protein
VLDQSKTAWTGSGVLHEAYAITCPHGQVGNRLWVRETWSFDNEVRHDFRPNGPRDLSGMELRDHVWYAADFEPRYGAWEHDVRPGLIHRCERWRPSIHMPRWASRITIEITDVRVERLQDVSEADAKAEGFPLPPGPMLLNGKNAHGVFFDARMGFQATWEAINGKRCPWSSNPWTFVISFKRVTP